MACFQLTNLLSDNNTYKKWYKPLICTDQNTPLKDQYGPKKVFHFLLKI